jgi:hypothetical protein
MLTTVFIVNYKKTNMYILLLQTINQYSHEHDAFVLKIFNTKENSEKALYKYKNHFNFRIFLMKQGKIKQSEFTDLYDSVYKETNISECTNLYNVSVDKESIIEKEKEKENQKEEEIDGWIYCFTIKEYKATHIKEFSSLDIITEESESESDTINDSD